MTTARTRPLESFYRRYNETCNAHRFSELAESWRRTCA
jgi:hypothetical protein